MLKFTKGKNGQNKSLLNLVDKPSSHHTDNSDDKEAKEDSELLTDYDEIEEEEEPSASDTMSLLHNIQSRAMSNPTHQAPTNTQDNSITTNELSFIKTEIQSTFDVQPNLCLPLVVEYSLGAISDRADIGCHSIHTNIEELNEISDEIIQKSKECSQLITKLNEDTLRVSKRLKATHQSIRQIKLPRRSILQMLVLVVIWIFNLFLNVYRRLKSRTSA